MATVDVVSVLKAVAFHPATLVAMGVAVVCAVVVVMYVLHELGKPPPTGGTPYLLPNGMKIQHWQKSETDFLYREIFGDESAYKSKENVIRFEPGATIVDAGANIGMFSLFAAQECRGDARIFCFEPMPSTFSVLKANAEFANAGAYSAQFNPAPGARLVITPLNSGLSDTEADVMFEHHPHFSVWSTQDATFAHQRLERIAADMPRAVKSNENPVVRAMPSWLISWLSRLVLAKLGTTERVRAHLDRLGDQIDRHGIKAIDVLKVDVEGAEIAVLKGIREDQWKKVQQVVLEVESFSIRDEIMGMLEKRGFKTSWVASERERNPGVQSEVCMLYAIRPEYSNRATTTAAAVSAGGKASAGGRSR